MKKKHNIEKTISFRYSQNLKLTLHCKTNGFFTSLRILNFILKIFFIGVKYIYLKLSYDFTE